MAKPSRLRRFVLYILKLALSLVILWLVFRKVEIAAVWQGILSIGPGLGCIILALSCLRHYLQYHNWLLALRINPGFVAIKSEVGHSYLVGNLLRFLLPGGHGSFGKVFFIQNSSRLASVAAVASEKLAQSWAVLLFASIGAAMIYRQLSLGLRIAAVVVMMILPLMAWLVVERGKRFAEIAPGFRRSAPIMLVIQIATNLLTMLQYWLLLSKLGYISFIQSFYRMSVVQFADTIPITISSLGLREGFATLLLQDVGFAARYAVTATLSLFIYQDIIPAIVGGIAMLKRNNQSPGAESI